MHGVKLNMYYYRSSRSGIRMLQVKLNPGLWSMTRDEVDRVAWLFFFTRCDASWGLLQYTQTGKCNLFVLYNKKSMVYWRTWWIFGAWKKENKSTDVIWRAWRHLCMCVIDHGQQPMEIHTEVMLLYNIWWCDNDNRLCGCLALWSGWYMVDMFVVQFHLSTAVHWLFLSHKPDVRD